MSAIGYIRKPCHKCLARGGIFGVHVKLGELVAKRTVSVILNFSESLTRAPVQINRRHGLCIFEFCNCRSEALVGNTLNLRRDLGVKREHKVQVAEEDKLSWPEKITSGL